MEDFRTDVTTLRAQARKQVEQGPVTDSYGADRIRVIEVLNEALATELVCVLRYRRHHFMAKGIEAQPIAAEFLAHAVEEQVHADAIATRITQLNGEPDFNPDTLSKRSHAEYLECDSLTEMITENLVAERVAIESYQAIIRWLGDTDSTTRIMLEAILAVEEEHANDLAGILDESRTNA